MGYTGLKASLFSAWPYLPTVGLLWAGSYISDKTKMRIPIIIFQSILMIIGFIRKPAQYCHFYILELILGSHAISIHKSSPLFGRLFCNHGLPVQRPCTDFPGADERHRVRTEVYHGSRHDVGRSFRRNHWKSHLPNTGCSSLYPRAIYLNFHGLVYHSGNVRAGLLLSSL
jgi:hypothetical protein